MTNTSLRLLALRASAALAAGLCQMEAPLSAGCNCQPAVAHPDPPAIAAPPHFGAHAASGFPYAPIPGPLPIGQTPAPNPPSPPPGTLGRTYQVPSRPVPADKHPRAAMIDVNVRAAAEVVVQNTNPFRTEEQLDGFRDAKDPDLWHFTSEPLYPGLPHIYRVEANLKRPGGDVTELRYVRLIMGRIVRLDF